MGEFDLDAGLPAKFERGHKLAELFAIEDHAVEDGAVFLVFIRSAWQAIDAALDSLVEIRFDARQRRESGVQSIKKP